MTAVTVITICLVIYWLWAQSRRIRAMKRWLRLYEWRYLDLAEWATENRTASEWTEKIDSHKNALGAAKVPWRLPE